MNWKQIVIGGLAAGVALNICEFLLHGFVMASTYAKYPDLFTQEQASPLWFLLVAVCVALVASYLFARTRQLWAAGAAGGAHFGFVLGLFAMLTFFYNPLVYEGYPYYLAWCQGSITLICMIVAGAVLGLIVKRAD